MEIQKKIWTSRYKQGVNCGFCTNVRINSMRGIQECLSRGVQARWPENSMDNVFCFFIPQVILQFTGEVQRFCHREKLYFSKDPEGSNIFQGGGGRGGPASIGGGGIRMLISL